MKAAFLLIAVLSIFSCGIQDVSESVLLDHSKTPFKDAKGNIQAVIEIPAGSNHKFEYNYTSKTFECEIVDGKPRVVKFLAYPGNYGFIPGTLMDKTRGGDGDAIDVLILGEAIPQGKVLPIKPIAMLKLMDRGEEDHKIIAVPINPILNTVGATTFSELDPSIKTIIQTWFTSYKGPGKMEFQGWENDSVTLVEIQKWKK